MTSAEREDLRRAIERAVARIRTARRGDRPAGAAAFEVWGNALRRGDEAAKDPAQLAALADDREAAAWFLRDRACHAPDPAPVRMAADRLAEIAIRVRSSSEPTPELADLLFELEIAAAEHLDRALRAFSAEGGTE